MKLNKLKEKLLLLHSGVCITHMANAKEQESRFRKYSEIPYSVHVTEVMKRVSHYGYNFENIDMFEAEGGAEYIFDILGASCGHDIEEDTTLDLDDFRKTWGDRIADIVHECSRAEGDAATRAEKWTFLCSFFEKSKEAVVIKIVDRFCNVMDYMDRDPKYAAKYALQAFPLYVRFVRLLGEDAFPEIVAQLIDEDIGRLMEIIRDRYGTDIVLVDTEEMLEKVRKLVT